MAHSACRTQTGALVSQTGQTGASWSLLNSTWAWKAEEFHFSLGNPAAPGIDGTCDFPDKCSDLLHPPTSFRPLGKVFYFFVSKHLNPEPQPALSE